MVNNVLGDVHMHMWGRVVGAQAVSLAVAFDGRHNSLNAMRLFLALAVIVSHAWPLSGVGADPMLGDLTLGHWAVAGFFSISGYLITASRLGETSTANFLLRRAARIYPGYWAVLAFVAFVAAPLALLLSGAPLSTWWSAEDNGLLYLLRNASLLRGQISLAGSPTNTPFASDWNGSLWSLPFEFTCYVAVALLGATAALRRSPHPILAATLGILVLNAALHLGVLPGAGNYYLDRFLTFGQFFFCGAALKALSPHIPVQGDLAVAAAGVLVVSALHGQSATFAGLPLAYLCMWLAIHLPLQAIGRKTDISYGVYLYAFPVQQLLAVAGVHQVSFLLYAMLSVLLTVPLGYLSFRYIEHPAQRMVAMLGHGERRALLAE
jgi:peptidoglycan/LPS O-acetylase OafA/YrhL